ncbi:hypothetical protein MES5069_350026 [Mesorhizobium escarrei]|uniref:Uncharacterized protein n=1 Tax=Mesorhizobium escarrei TaxID=666018 RepID=A0ABN8JZX1_9HYPH|nr:hypothetical protein MES5069_350026 [Mesorhizobium escarrei]
MVGALLYSLYTWAKATIVTVLSVFFSGLVVIRTTKVSYHFGLNRLVFGAGKSILMPDVKLRRLFGFFRTHS